VKSEALWKTLALAGTPALQRDVEAQPRFGAGDGRTLGASEILFPRIDLKTVVRA
jgi:hypothetical protein